MCLRDAWIELDSSSLSSDWEQSKEHDHLTTGGGGVAKRLQCLKHCSGAARTCHFIETISHMIFQMSDAALKN